MEIKHATQATLPNDASKEVSKNAWNEAHQLTLSQSGVVVGLRSGSPDGGPAEEIPISELGKLADSTGTDANTTMAANTRYDVDMSAWATADRDYTLPTTATVGDEIEVFVQIGNASYELILKTGAGQTCAFAGSTVAAATEITRLFIIGERMRFRYHATNKWECVLDKRIPQQASMRLSTAAAGESAATFTQPTAKSGVWTADIDNASLTNAASDQIKTRRAGNFLVSAMAASAVTLTDQKYFGLRVFKNGVVTVLIAATTYASLTGQVGLAFPAAALFPLVADDYIVYSFISEEGGKGLVATASPRLVSAFALTEVL